MVYTQKRYLIEPKQRNATILAEFFIAKISIHPTFECYMSVQMSERSSKRFFCAVSLVRSDCALSPGFWLSTI